MLDGNMPLHVFEAPESGSGKSLLGDVCSIIATGRRMAWRPFPIREEEREKSIFSALRSGHTFVAFDNVKGEIESPALESALTSEFIQSRVLGGHSEETVRNAASWVLAVNNAQLCRDLVRRSVRSRIDAKMENPEERTLFRHQDLRAWVLDNRAALVRALLLLVQNWIARGRPNFTGTPQASFERWSRVIGGILENAGIAGFLSPAVSMAGADPRKPEAAAFVVAWFEQFRTDPVTAKDLLDAICAPPDQAYADLRPPREVTHLVSVLGAGPVGGRSVRLGKWLAQNVDRVRAGFRIERVAPNAHTKVNRFALKQLGAASQPAQEEAPTTIPAPGVVDNLEFGD
jgi:hypothetical protein